MRNEKFERDDLEKNLFNWVKNKLNVSDKIASYIAKSVSIEIIDTSKTIFDIEIETKFEMIKEKVENALEKEGLELEIATIEIETEKLKNNMKKHRKQTTKAVLVNLALFAFIFSCLRIYRENTFLLSILQTIVIQYAIGFILMVVKYLKWRKDANKYG
jgi:hypothetical protein